MGSKELKIGPPDFLIELQVGRAALSAVLGAFVENPAHKKRVVADVCAQQETLLCGRTGQRDQHVGEILLAGILLRMRRAEVVGARKSLEARTDVIRQL